MKPRLLVFASGTETGGGSGFEHLVLASRDGRLDADIVGVISNHPIGGVCEKARGFEIPFIHFLPPRNAERYESLVKYFSADFVALSGWLKLVSGIDPRRTFNIHPGPLPRFGGNGLHGDYVHKAVLEAYRAGLISHTEVSMHFITNATEKKDYDKGPVFFRVPVEIRPDDTIESLAHRVNEVEHAYQPLITDMVVKGMITWDGKNPDSLVVPDGYDYHLPIAP